MYSDELKKDLKELYPLDIIAQELAECNSPNLTLRLQDSWGGFSPEEILESKSLDSLKEKALVIKQKKELYIRSIKEM